ncbi:MAG: HAD family hydrolase, partial [Pirellulaceae bacterium]|nr:HAD family hydrolase [Pirellulaceae bacterium]
MKNVRGLIFDLDGTLVDSQLDFDLMRSEMQLPPGPILESIAALPVAPAERCYRILRRHEMEGAERATLLPGVAQLLERAQERFIPIGIVTRNSREISLAVLHRLQLKYDILLARDDGPIKPDPWAVRHICERWNVPARQVVMIGDYHFDVLSGRGAGARTVLLTHPVPPREYPNLEQADLLLSSLAEHDA